MVYLYPHKTGRHEPASYNVYGTNLIRKVNSHAKIHYLDEDQLA